MHKQHTYNQPGTLQTMYDAASDAGFAPPQSSVVARRKDWGRQLPAALGVAAARNDVWPSHRELCNAHEPRRPHPQPDGSMPLVRYKPSQKLSQEPSPPLTLSGDHRARPEETIGPSVDDDAARLISGSSSPCLVIWRRQPTGAGGPACNSCCMAAASPQLTHSAKHGGKKSSARPPSAAGGWVGAQTHARPRIA